MKIHNRISLKWPVLQHLRNENRTKKVECFKKNRELLCFCTSVNSKIYCLICNNCIATPKQCNVKKHYKKIHRALCHKYKGPLHASKLKELKANLNQQQTCLVRIQRGSVATVTASYELTQMNAKVWKTLQ